MTLPLQRPVWIEKVPPAKRDVRNLHVDFPSLAADMRELRTRIATLERGNSRASARLANVLRNGLRADTACCPLVCRQFRIWFVGAALAIHDARAARPDQDLDEAEVVVIDFIDDVPCCECHRPDYDKWMAKALTERGLPFNA